MSILNIGLYGMQLFKCLEGDHNSHVEKENPVFDKPIVVKKRPYSLKATEEPL